MKIGACPFHKAVMVSMPRDPDEPNAESFGYAYKCPIRHCSFGIMAQIDTLLLEDFDAVLAERDFLLNNFVETPDGKFKFPNGDTYRCKLKLPPGKELYGSTASPDPGGELVHTIDDTVTRSLSI